MAEKNGEIWIDLSIKFPEYSSSLVVVSKKNSLLKVKKFKKDDLSREINWNGNLFLCPN